MGFKQRRFWKIRIGEAFVWPVPVLLALMGHTYALPKANIRGVGPGMHIALMNDRTVRAQYMWHILAQHYWLFILYGVALVGTFIMLRVKHISLGVRIIVFVLMSIPGFWYCWEASYLGGKLLMMGH